MISLTMKDGEVIKCKKGSNLVEISKQVQAKYSSPIVEGIVNGILTDLQMELEEDATLDFVEVNSEEGMRVYVRTLFYLFLVAAKHVRPDLRIESRNTLSSALYCIAKGGNKMTKGDLAKITSYMQELIEKKEPIKLNYITREEAKEALIQAHRDVALKQLDKFPKDEKLYSYNLKDNKEYFFGSLYYDVTLVKHFELLLYQAGLVINYPDTGNFEVMPPFKPSEAMNKVYQNAEEWSAMVNCNTVVKLNNIILENQCDKIVCLAEAYQEKRISAIADEITKKSDRVKVVLIAGPSSSGKTSFAQRLSVQLAVNGLQPITISMDDYYKNRADTPRKADGSYDFECVEAIDLELFNQQLLNLLAGKTIKVPKYNFREGVREYRGQTMTMDEKSILVIEGIHGLNEQLTKQVPGARKIKIYVSALTPMSIDDYNRIQTTDMRLLRRIVRDSQFRSHDAAATLELWPSVREGEEKYIFPFQEEANIIFNTTLIYEFAVLKGYAKPLLEAVTPEEKCYTNARRLLKLLELVEPMPIEAIPNNSLLREFVGGSIFKAVQ